MHKRAFGRNRPALRIVAAGAAVARRAACHAQESPAGRFTFELRPRYNHIEESDKPEVTRGGTVRILAGYASAPIDGTMRIVLEGIHADHIDPHFNDDGNNFASSPYPLLPDPKYTGINQAYVDFTGIESARVRAGRQVVRMDNQRWVSDNNFRQTPQVFDGVSARYGTPWGSSCTARTFGQVRTTSGDENDLNLTLLHAAWNPLPGHALVAYGYFHDQPSNGAFTVSRTAPIGWRACAPRARVSRGRIRFSVRGGSRVAAARTRAAIRASTRSTGAWAAAPAAPGRCCATTTSEGQQRRGLRRADAAHRLSTPSTVDAALLQHPAPGAARRMDHAEGRAGRTSPFYGESHRFRSDYGSIDFGKELDVGPHLLLEREHDAALQHARYDPGPTRPIRPCARSGSRLPGPTDDAVLEGGLDDLRQAKLLLENPGLAAKLASYVGSPVEKGMKMLPQKWQEGVHSATEKRS
jgi:hypothetical protein